MNSYSKIQNLVEKTYGARYRLRVCGIAIKENKLLLVKNLGVGEDGFLWGPPGGEVQFGEGIEKCVEREFYEETGVLARASDFLFISEFIKKPFHAVELFFAMDLKSHEIKLGSDPEVGNEIQSLGEVKWMSFEEINSLEPKHKHGLFNKFRDMEGLLNCNGFLRV